MSCVSGWLHTYQTIMNYSTVKLFQGSCNESDEVHGTNILDSPCYWAAHT